MTHSRPSSRTRVYPRPDRRQRGRSIWVLLVLLLLWSICLGLGLAQATEPKAIKLAQTAVASPTPSNPLQAATQPATVGTVDVIPARYQAGYQLYLQTCATCHVGIPPEVMPTETWRQLLPDPQHYGLELKPLQNPDLRIAWEYLRTFSRPQAADEAVPYRIYQSRYFKALHPRVKLPPKAGLGSCISCHPGAGAYDFRSLSAEWQNAP